PQSAKPIYNMGNLLQNIPSAPLFEEFSKMFLTGNAAKTYILLCEYQLFKQLFPRAATFSSNNAFVMTALHNTDQRYAADKSLTPSFLLAVFGWQPVQDLMLQKDFREAMDQVLSEQQRIMAVPRRFVSMIRDIWELQPRLERRRTARQIEGLFALTKFRAAYDFLLLRAESGDEVAEKAALWWRKYVEGDEE